MSEVMEAVMFEEFSDSGGGSGIDIDRDSERCSDRSNERDS